MREYKCTIASLQHACFIDNVKRDQMRNNEKSPFVISHSPIQSKALIFQAAVLYKGCRLHRLSGSAKKFERGKGGINAKAIERVWYVSVT